MKKREIVMFINGINKLTANKSEIPADDEIFLRKMEQKVNRSSRLTWREFSHLEYLYVELYIAMIKTSSSYSLN